jgi:iron complex outermembrane receptor protein
VPGPDNRLDDQAKATANIGADYRFRGTPLTMGGNFNWVPGTLTRRAADETSATSTKRQWDVFALWTFSPTLGLRLLANNVDPRGYTTEGSNDVANNISGLTERSRTLSGGPSYTNLTLRLEMKL